MLHIKSAELHSMPSSETQNQLRTKKVTTSQNASGSTNGLWTAQRENFVFIEQNCFVKGVKKEQLHAGLRFHAFLVRKGKSFMEQKLNILNCQNKTNKKIILLVLIQFIRITNDN